MNKFVLLGVIIFLLSPTMIYAQKKAANQSDEGEIIYHLFQRSFYDSNGDNMGDLRGIIQKLDYLRELGITSLLLLPLYDADCYHNYFANDFEKIDPEYGSMNEYVALVREVHKRNMKIYLDMETQYVTSKHEWWKSAVGNLNSPYSKYILFQDEAHTKPSTIIYDLTGLTGYDGTDIKITTVNLKSEEVLNYNKKLFSFFADPNNDGKFDDGADGFRLDHTMDHLDNKPTLENLFNDFWHSLIQKVKLVNPKIEFIAEQANWGDLGLNYFEKAGVDKVFAFQLGGAILSFKKNLIINKADTIFKLTPAGKEQIVFVENHDLDRSASLFNKDVNKEKVAAAVMLLIGGTPSIYYGQEIGMTGKGGFGIYGNTDGNDIPRREAFEWTRSGSGNGMALWYKNTGPWWDNSYIKPNDGISLEEQKNDPNSLFTFYKSIIKLRKSSEALSIGDFQNAANNNEYVLTFTRNEKSEKVFVAINLSGERQVATLEKPVVNYHSLYGETSITGSKIELKSFEIIVGSMKD